LLKSTYSHLPPSKTSPTSLSLIKLFGTKKRRRNRWQRQHCKNDFRLHSSISADNTNAIDDDADVDGNPSSSSSNTNTVGFSSSSSSSSSTSLLNAIDSFGMKLKPWAVLANTKSVSYSTSNSNNGSGRINGGTPPTNDDDNSNNKSRVTPTIITNNIKSLLHKLEAIALWIAYIIYRGYRGFFVLLPAVFREVYRQLESSDLDLDVYDDDDDNDNDDRLAIVATTSNAIINDQQQQQQSMKLRTRLTISILSIMVTFTYVLSGGLRVVGKFIKTFTNTTSIESSLEAAADEVVSNENVLREKMK
jgi:hypothetical protein